MRIAFYQARFGNWLDTLISWWTRGPFSHAEIVFSDGKSFSSSIRDKGVRTITIKDETHWTFFELHLSTEAEQKIRVFCEGELGKEYDLLGTLGFILPTFRPEKKKWFCSEFVVASLQQCGMLHWIKAGKINPNKLYGLLTSQNVPPKTSNR